MKRIIHLLVLPLLLVAVGAQARLSIEITEGVEGALPIGIVPFGWTGTAPPQEMAAIIGADLARSGRFAPIAADRLPERPQTIETVSFDRWRGLTDSLVVGQVAAEGNGYRVRFQLVDALRGDQLAGYSIRTDAAGMRRVAHQIADIVYQTLTGERGAFDTRIAYVTVAQEGGKRVHRLAIADADGHDEQIIYTSEHPLMSPYWSPDVGWLAYVSFEEGASAVYRQNVMTGERERVAGFRGINSAPAFSPDGRRLALTLSRDGNAEIYVLELANRRLIRITDNLAIDTEPAWTPDGQALIFTSDRGGQPQLYRVRVGANGPLESPRRITFEGSYNARATVSPDGRRIAMVHGGGGGFRIAVMDLESGNLRVLTRTRLDESPSFAPNGSMIIYATEVGGRGVLEAVSVDGRAHQRLGLHRGDVREPAWSPFLGK